MKLSLLLLAASLVCGSAGGAGNNDLRLTDGGFVRGELKASEQPDRLRWKSPQFTQPLEFSWDGVSAIYFNVAATVPKPTGEYRLELAGGDVLYGDLFSVTESTLELDVATFGRLHVARDQIRRLSHRNDGEELIFLGPNGLSGWTESSTAATWSEEGGQPVTDHEGTHVRGDFGIPAQALIEFAISWKTKADFVFALGVTDKDDEAVFKRAFRFEVWDNQLVVFCEGAREADVELIQDIPKGPGRIHLLAYLDQEQGTLLVYSPSGSHLAELHVTNRNSRVHSGVRVANKQGDVRLEQLRISRWNGISPAEGIANKSRIHRADGAVLYGELARYDADAKMFVIRSASEETKLAADQIASVFISPTEDQPPQAIRAVLRDFIQVSGELTRIEDDHVWLTRKGIQEALRLPLSEMRSFIVLQHRESTLPARTERLGHLELDGLRLPGRLVSGQEQTDASCLVWHPDLGVNASPLSRGSAGRIVYRDPPPAPSKSSSEPMPRQPRNVIMQIPELPAVPQPQRATPRGEKILHLRSGDTIPCHVTKIDEQGITFTTPLSDATFVAHDKVKAVEFEVDQSPPKLTKAKRERILTLPRAQRDSPPTQLILSKNGDFLRGRLIDMDAGKLRVEIRLEIKEIPRSRVAQIIWLHADELNDSPAPVSIASGSAMGTRVQAVRSDGRRLTFFADRLEEQTLFGTSDVLGNCHTDLSQVDQLLLGKAIENAAQNLVYHRWKLRQATEPKIAQDSDLQSAAGRIAGTESALVGKPAPDFELDLLDGKKFRLKDSNGRIVVLDFWATWCGPCLQAMPQVDRVVREFSDQDVQLIAVNLEESAAQITSAMERHKLQMPVVLDRDGVVAAKYEATAIPQTVIVDRDGNISRLYVGGGQHLAEQVRESLQKLVAPKPTVSDQD